MAQAVELVVRERSAVCTVVKSAVMVLLAPA